MLGGVQDPLLPARGTFPLGEAYPAKHETSMTIPMKPE
jgi:hypothetical protein